MSLATVTLQDGLNTIGENAFFCCTSLKTLNMPASVKSIGNQRTAIKNSTDYLELF